MLAATPRTLLEPPGVRGEPYARWLLETCRANGIQLVIPGKERTALGSWRERFTAAGVTLIVPGDTPTQDRLERKDAFLRSWDETILPIPRWTTFCDPETFDAARAELQTTGVRLCMKPAQGLYASGFRVLLEHPDVKTFLNGELYEMSVAAARELLAAGPWPTMLLMHTLEGTERSIDCVAWQGRLIRAVVRRKDTYGQFLEDRPDLVRAAARVAQGYALSGIFNFQTKDDGDGVAHMLEINARASGGLRTSMAAGVNFARLLLDAATGRLEPDALPPVRTGLRVVEERTGRVVGVPGDHA